MGVYFYPPSVENLIMQLGKLPGVGPKTAQRLAFHLLNAPEEDAPVSYTHLDVYKRQAHNDRDWRFQFMGNIGNKFLAHLCDLFLLPHVFL